MVPNKKLSIFAIEQNLPSLKTTNTLAIPTPLNSVGILVENTTAHLQVLKKIFAFKFYKYAKSLIAAQYL